MGEISDHAAMLLREQGWPVVAVVSTNEQDYAYALQELGVPFEQRPLPWIFGSGFGEAYEVTYESPKLRRRVWAYVLTHADVDTYAQNIVVCERSIEDSKIGDLLEGDRSVWRSALRRAIDSGAFS